VFLREADPHWFFVRVTITNRRWKSRFQ